MKKLLFGLILFTTPAFAQETYSLPASAQNVTDLTGMVDANNGRVCERYALAAACTQAQACTAAVAPGGASCTAAQARSVSARIFPQTQAGREEFVTFQIALPPFLALRLAIVGRAQEQAAAFWATANTTQRNVICAAYSLPNGCLLYP